MHATLDCHGLFGKQDSQQPVQTPTKQAVNRDCDQGDQFKRNTLQCWRASESLKYGNEWLGRAVDQLRKWIEQADTPQVQHEAQDDQDIDRVEAQGNQ